MEMDLDRAIMLLKKTVKDNGTNDSRHMDLTLVPGEDRPLYESALKVAKMSIIEGKLSQDEFLARIQLHK